MFRIRMKLPGLMLLGCVWSALTLQLSSAAANMTRNCTSLPTYLKILGYEDLMTWQTISPTHGPCIDQLITLRNVYNSGKHSAYANFTAQYCSGVLNYTNCSGCFLGAFEDIWNQNICLFFNKYRVRDILRCLQMHPNERFNWSRGVVFEQEHKSVNVTRGKYETCKDVFAPQDIPTNKTVIFPVYLKLQLEIDDTIINTFLSLLLQAFELKDANSSTGVTCRHLVDSRTLRGYKYLSEAKINKTPREVLNSFSKLRSSMCSGSSNITTCEECFRPADELFLFHVYNKDKKASSMKRDFLAINSTLTDCIRNHSSSSYSSLEGFIRRSEGSWYVGFGGCWNDTYEGIVRNNTKPVIGVGSNEAVVKSVAANYFAFAIYQGLIGNTTRNCTDVWTSRIMCTAAKTIEAITIHSRYVTNITEDVQSLYLAVNIGACGMQSSF